MLQYSFVNVGKYNEYPKGGWTVNDNGNKKNTAIRKN
jgi:hypothetical protein